MRVRHAIRARRHNKRDATPRGSALATPADQHPHRPAVLEVGPTSDILSSRENPKICGIDDAEVVGDLVAVDMPVPRHLLAQKS